MYEIVNDLQSEGEKMCELSSNCLISCKRISVSVIPESILNIVDEVCISYSLHIF